MGKSTKRKLEEREAAEQNIAARLSARGGESGKTYRGVVSGLEIIPAHAHDFSDLQLRDLDNWTYKGKSKNKEKQQIALIRYLFAKYPVPRFLEDAFISKDQNTRTAFSSWYIAVAQGQSLYKTCSREILSKKESHWLLQAPDDLNIKQAVWWAKAMALNENIGIAYRLARSVITERGEYTKEFWIDIHRFFVNNPVPLKELSELVDYMLAARAENPAWTIKKRSLASLYRQSEKWHRDMAKLRQLGGGAWPGMSIPDWTCKTGKPNYDPQKNTEQEWVVKEIRTGNDLAKEGNRMRHCVFGYKQRCISGEVSIFTMQSSTILKSTQRHLTIEVRIKTREVVQARGLANRLPRPHEENMLHKWAADQKLLVKRKFTW